MKWELLIANPVRRAIRDMPRADSKLIDDALEEMRSDPYSGDIKLLKGTDRAWRIMFDVRADTRIVAIHDVERRGSNTY